MTDRHQADHLTLERDSQMKDTKAFGNYILKIFYIYDYTMLLYIN